MKPAWKYLGTAITSMGLALCAAQAQPASANIKTSVPSPTLQIEPESAASNLWESGKVGAGFSDGVWRVGLAAGGGPGLQAFGSRVEHDLVLGTIEAGRMTGGVMGKDSWYRGNWEITGLLTGGAQVDPDSAYLAALGLGFRYHFFGTGTRLVPFLGWSLGAMATDIKQPDLSSVFQFNLQWSAGFNWFFRDNMSLSAETRLFHISNAGIESPNRGVNTLLFMGGIHCYF